MRRLSSLTTAVLSLLVVMAVAAAQETDTQQAEDSPTVQVLTEDALGAYLADGEGRTLYAFAAPEMGQEVGASMSEGVRESAVSCTGECLNAWPAFTAGEGDGDVVAGEGVDEELLYTATVDGRTQVIYNGWPLYYFSQDEQARQVGGQGIESFGGEWLILDADGQLIEPQAGDPEGEGGQEGAAEGDGAQDGDMDGDAPDDDAMDGDGAQDDAQQDGTSDGGTTDDSN